MRTLPWFTGLALLTVSGSLLAQEPPLPPKREGGDLRFNVKTRTKFEGLRSDLVWGTVDKLGPNSVTVKYKNFWDSAKEDSREVFAVDVLTKGNVLGHVSAAYSYRWSDLKEGDRVYLEVVHDSGDGKDYLFSICIERRPGAKLPESQNLKGDIRYFRDRLLNDIDNGEDVTEADIADRFPPTLHPETKVVMRSGGLPCEYAARLHDLREKLAAGKEKRELKAPSPHKDK